MKTFIILALLFPAVPAAAQSIVSGPNQPGRYEMQPVPGGIARLDTVTSDLSLCRVMEGTLRCRPSEDDASSSSEDDRAPALSNDDRERDSDTAERDRTDAEIDRAIGRVKRVFRAFGDIAREFDRNGDEGSGPDRT